MQTFLKLKLYLTLSLSWVRFDAETKYFCQIECDIRLQLHETRRACRHAVVVNVNETLFFDVVILK